jgi:hypothetical protein
MVAIDGPLLKTFALVGEALFASGDAGLKIGVAFP